MRSIGWTPKSLRAFKRVVKRNPQIRSLLGETLRQLAEDPFQSGLQTHKLMGDLSGVWSCSVAYDLRILFEFVKNQEGEDSILLLNIGSHDEVY